MSAVADTPAPPRAVHPRKDHAMARLIRRRLALGVLTLWIVSAIVFFATEILPGNAAYAILGHSATPARLHALEVQLHLNHPVITQYFDWLKDLLLGHFGTSLASGQSVWTVVGPRLANSALLVILAGVIGTFIGVAMGAVVALRKDSVLDHVVAVVTLAITALPEFVVAVVMVIVFSTVVFHALPSVSLPASSKYVWTQPKLLILPVATLVIVVVPYVLRMMRAATIEALESDYVEMASLKGLPKWRVVIAHALPNAVAPTVQVIGLTILYLAGGIVLVEDVFTYPGIGQELVNAVSNRDIPELQFIVLLLALFYVVVNITTDVIALWASPRHRLGRS